MLKREEKNVYSRVNMESVRIHRSKGKEAAYEYVDGVIKQLELDLKVSRDLLLKLTRLRNLYDWFY